MERNISDGLSRYPGNGSKYNSIAVYFELRKEFNEKTNLNIGSRYSFVDISAEWDLDFLMENQDSFYFLNNFIILN